MVTASCTPDGSQRQPIASPSASEASPGETADVAAAEWKAYLAQEVPLWAEELGPAILADHPWIDTVDRTAYEGAEHAIAFEVRAKTSYRDLSDPRRWRNDAWRFAHAYAGELIFAYAFLWSAETHDWATWTPGLVLSVDEARWVAACSGPTISHIWQQTVSGLDVRLWKRSAAQVIFEVNCRFWP